MGARSAVSSAEEREEVRRDGANRLRSRATRFAALGATIACVFLVACGGGGSGGNEEEPAASASVDQDAPVPIPKAKPLDSVVSQLEGEGFNCRPSGGTDKGLVQAVDCNAVTIIAWSTLTATTRYEVVAIPIVEEDPGSALFAIGADRKTTAFTGSTKKLTATEVSEFEQVKKAIRAN